MTTAEGKVLPLVLGYLSVFCFTVQYIPQLVLNWRRQSVTGFNTTGIIIKYIGAAFHAFTALSLGEELPVVLYGAGNMFQHALFLVQFTLYTGRAVFLRWIAFPLFPWLLVVTLPLARPVANLVKPACQVISHFPQLATCIQRKTTHGVSMFSQHLNFVGGCCGLYMCYWVPPSSFFTYVVYTNSILQASSTYLLCAIYDGPSFLLKGTLHDPHENEHLPVHGSTNGRTMSSSISSASSSSSTGGPSKLLGVYSALSTRDTDSGKDAGERGDDEDGDENGDGARGYRQRQESGNIPPSSPTLLSRPFVTSSSSSSSSSGGGNGGHRSLGAIKGGDALSRQSAAPGGGGGGGGAGATAPRASASSGEP